MAETDKIAPSVWLAGALTFAAFTLSKSALSEWLDPLGVAVVFWLFVVLASVCGFMALRTYFISVGRQRALEEIRTTSGPGNAFISMAEGGSILQSEIRDNSYVFVGPRWPTTHASADVRPWISVTYSSNATEEEPELPDSMIFENVGEEVALGIDFATRPPTFGSDTPRLALSPVARVLPGPAGKEEASVFAVESFLRRIRKSLSLRREPPFLDLRIPLEVSYSDRRGRRWSNDHALVYNGIGTWIEDVTGRDPQWTDLSDVSDAPKS